MCREREIAQHPAHERRRSFAFEDGSARDGKGKEVSPRLMLAPRPPALPARLEPATFAFAPGEAHRDVLLIVDAPDGRAQPRSST